MAIGTQEIERQDGNLRTGSSRLIERISWEYMDVVSKRRGKAQFWKAQAVDHYQVTTRVVEFLEQILDGPVLRKLEPQPREAIAGARVPGGGLSLDCDNDLLR